MATLLCVVALPTHLSAQRPQNYYSASANPRYEIEVLEDEPRVPLMNIKTNALEVAMLIANIGVEFRITPRLSLTLSVRNLLGNRNIVYGGYESSRIRNYMSGAQRIYAPQDDVLTYAYPRTYYVVLSWKM